MSLVSSASPEQVAQLYQALWRDIFIFERRFSRFLPGSELSLLNRNAGAKHGVSPEFRLLLVAARDSAQQSGGLYNPFILPALQAAGYRHSRVPGHEHDTVDDHSHKVIATIDQLEIGDDWVRIPYGTALDLGGCGKGYLATQLQRSLPDYITGYWLSLGGDIAVGGHDAHGEPWAVGVQNADPQATDVGTLVVTEPCGIATSGTTVHKGKTAGKTWHHLVDPRTNAPAKTDVELATVCDPSPLRADVLASCAIILGSERGIQFLQEQNVRAAVLQCAPHRGRPRVLYFGSGIIMDSIYA